MWCLSKKHEYAIPYYSNMERDLDTRLTFFRGHLLSRSRKQQNSQKSRNTCGQYFIYYVLEQTELFIAQFNAEGVDVNNVRVYSNRYRSRSQWGNFLNRDPERNDRLPINRGQQSSRVATCTYKETLMLSCVKSDHLSVSGALSGFYT
jgi:hypothetical protein